MRCCRRAAALVALSRTTRKVDPLFSPLQVALRCTHQRPILALSLSRRCCSASMISEGIELVSSLDLYCHGRVLNLLRRCQEASQHESIFAISSSRYRANDLEAQQLHCLDEKAALALRFKKDASCSADVWVTEIQVTFYFGARKISFVALGVAENDKESRTLAAMHAERCVDAYAVPLFALPRMQEKHVERCKESGRWAPLLSDALKPPGGVSTPPPLGLRLPIGAPPMRSARTDPFMSVSKSTLSPTIPRSTLRAPVTSKAEFKRKGLDDFDIRFGCDPFRRGSRGTDEYYRSSIFSYSKDTAETMTNDDRRLMESATELSQETEAELIAGSDVKLLSNGPPGCPSSAVVPQIARAKGAKHVSFDRLVTSGLTIDESEGGRFDMCEEESTWVSDSRGPLILCLKDTAALARVLGNIGDVVRHLLQGDETAALVTLELLEERLFEFIPTVEEAQLTPRATGKVKWYEARMGVPFWLFEYLRLGYAECVQMSEFIGNSDDILSILQNDKHLVAVGKASTIQDAKTLCAMHLERLCEQFGVCQCPLRPEAALEYKKRCADFGRSWGTPLVTRGEWQLQCNTLGRDNLTSRPLHDPHLTAFQKFIGAATQRRLEALGGGLQKPIKAWRKLFCHADLNKALRRTVDGAGSGDGVDEYGKLRLRMSKLTANEILLALNRQIVAAGRIHVVEVDFTAAPDVLAEAIAALRQFMLANKRWGPTGAEAAFFAFVYGPAQYRCTIHLPLPKEYGVRGGYAIGVSPESAKGLCALNALDVLCALGVPVFSDPATQQDFVQRRQAQGLIVPQQQTLAGVAVNVKNLDVRSPPGYRENIGGSAVAPCAADLWNVMLLDAAEFDVAHEQSDSEFSKVGGERSFLRMVFNALLASCGCDAAWGARHTLVYAGSQRVGHRTRIAANNMWISLPLDPKTFGRRIALGRCVSRNGAERSMIVHAIRIFLHLNMVPEKIVKDYQLGPLWQQLCDRYWHKSSASVEMLPGTDRTQLSSPNPVMSLELARKTFLGH